VSEQLENLKRELYLRAVDLLQAMVEAGDLDKKKGERLIGKLKRTFAELFVEGISSLEFVYSDMCVDVWPYWLVTGQPKKLAKAKANKWMAGRGLTWNGSASELIQAVRKAVAKGEIVPDGYFGLHVERTVKIRWRKELSTHLPPEKSYFESRAPFIWVGRGDEWVCSL